MPGPVIDPNLNTQIVRAAALGAVNADVGNAGAFQLPEVFVRALGHGIAGVMRLLLNVSSGQVALGGATSLVGSSALTMSGTVLRLGTGVGSTFMTTTGGHGVVLTADENLSKGHVVSPTSALTADRVRKCPTNGLDPCGVVLENATAGGEVFVVTDGRAQFLIDTTVTTTNRWFGTSATNAGFVTPEATGGGVAAHFQECGHPIETKVAAGLTTLCWGLFHKL